MASAYGLIIYSGYLQMHRAGFRNGNLHDDLTSCFLQRVNPHPPHLDTPTNTCKLTNALLSFFLLQTLRLLCFSFCAISAVFPPYSLFNDRAIFYPVQIVRSVTISEQHHTNVVAKIIHKSDIITISIEKIKQTVDE